jgi:hypothetical protein
MELVAHRIILPNTASKLFIHLITDVHREATGCDDHKFRADIKKIYDANQRISETNETHYWIGGGDWNNGITAKDKRFDATAVSDKFRKYVGNNLHKKVADTLIREVESIAPWCLGYGRGNHEDGVIKWNDFDPADAVAQGLNVNYLGYSAGIRLTIGTEINSKQSTTLILLWHHGFGAARSKASKMNMLLKLGSLLLADVYMTGHVHEPIGFPGIRMELSRTGFLRQIARPIIYVNGGTYQRAYQPTSQQEQKAGEYNIDHDIEVDYAEKAAYEPAVIGHFGWSFEWKRTGGRKGSWDYELKAIDFR